MSKKDPSKLIGSLDAIGRKMEALRAGALTADEAIARAAKDAKELRAMFPLDVDALFKKGMSPTEQLDALKKYQGWTPERAGPEGPDKSRNVQDAAWFASQSPEAQAARLRGGVGPGMSAGSGWAAGAEGAVNVGIHIPADYSESARQRREQRAGGWNEAAAADIIRQLETLKARLEKVFDGPVYITLLIEQAIRNIQAKVVTPDEALAFMRYVLGTMSAGLQQEAMSDVSSIRNVANDLLRFAGGAALPGGAGSLTPGPRPLPTPAEEAAQRAGTTGGIGTNAPATRGDVAALGATITRTVEQQTNVTHGVAVAVAAQANETRTAQQEANRRLAEEFRSIHGWQQRVETGYFRPMHEGITEVRRNAALGATQTRQLAAALERAQLSGALTSGTTQ
jgi:hypothetical protein